MGMFHPLAFSWLTQSEKIPREVAETTLNWICSRDQIGVMVWRERRRSCACATRFAHVFVVCVCVCVCDVFLVPGCCLGLV